jgi:hypothetical protein
MKPPPPPTYRNPILWAAVAFCLIVLAGLVLGSAVLLYEYSRMQLPTYR